MKSSQEKAEELVEKFKFETKRSEMINDILLGDISVIFKHYKAKQCALIAIDEIIKSKPYKFVPFLDYTDCTVLESNIKYWQEVKQEIEKL
jgi:hypothetical protein